MSWEWGKKLDYSELEHRREEIGKLSSALPTMRSIPLPAVLPEIKPPPPPIYMESPRKIRPTPPDHPIPKDSSDIEIELESGGGMYVSDRSSDSSASRKKSKVKASTSSKESSSSSSKKASSSSSSSSSKKDASPSRAKSSSSSSKSKGSPSKKEAPRMGPGISSYFTAKVPGPASSAHESAAEGFKDEGNDYLKAQKYTEAIESYRKAIDAVWPKGKNLHIYYSNRAAARMKRGKSGDNDEAIKDAQLSVKADPTYCKGYNRLGSALEYANRNSEAVIAYKKCLEHEPENATALDAMSRINKAVRPSAKAVKASDEGDVICIDEDDNNDDVMIVSESPSSSSSSSSSSSAASFSSASSMWICQKCTLKNEFKSSLCTACGSSKLKTGSSSSSSSTSNVPPTKSKSTSNKKSNDKEEDEEEDEDDDDDEDDGDDDEDDGDDDEDDGDDDEDDGDDDDDDDDDSDEGFGRKKTSTKKRKSVTKDSKKPSKKKR